MSDDTVGKAVTAATEVAPQEDKEQVEYVTLPEFDVYDEPYPEFAINKLRFAPNMTHAVSPEIAGELRTMIRRFEKSRIRLLQKNPDTRSLKQSTGSGVNQIPL